MDSQAHQDRIVSRLSGMFGTGTTEGTVTGGSFEYTEADMTKIRDNWLDLAHSYQKSLRNAGFMARIEPPADDMASTFHSTAANRSGESYKDYLEHNQHYCLRQAQLFQDVLDDYLGVERTNISDFNEKMGDNGPQPGV